MTDVFRSWTLRIRNVLKDNEAVKLQLCLLSSFPTNCIRIRVCILPYITLFNVSFNKFMSLHNYIQEHFLEMLWMFRQPFLFSLASPVFNEM